MLQMRGWGRGKALAEWNEVLRNTPPAEIGTGGPTEAPTVLPIPSWYTGSDSSIDQTKNFTRKEMNTAGKRMKLNEEELEAAVNDCATGSC